MMWNSANSSEGLNERLARMFARTICYCRLPNIKSVLDSTQANSKNYDHFYREYCQLSRSFLPKTPHGDRAASCRSVLNSLPLPGRVPLIHSKALLQNVTRSGYNFELVQCSPNILRGKWYKGIIQTKPFPSPSPHSIPISPDFYPLMTPGSSL